jgi:hypothetical protein
MVPADQRTFQAFLVALWRRPGFRLTLTSLVGLGLIVLRKGAVNLLVTLAIALPLGLALGYRSFRRTGRV